MRTEADSATVWLRAPRLWLAGLTMAAFANSLANGFVWLDHWQVESGGLIVPSWAELWSALLQPLGAMPGWEGSAPYARPCVVLLLSAVHAVAGVLSFVFALGAEESAVIFPSDTDCPGARWVGGTPAVCAGQWRLGEAHGTRHD